MRPVRGCGAHRGRRLVVDADTDRGRRGCLARCGGGRDLYYTSPASVRTSRPSAVMRYLAFGSESHRISSTSPSLESVASARGKCGRSDNVMFERRLSIWYQPSASGARDRIFKIAFSYVVIVQHSDDRERQGLQSVRSRPASHYGHCSKGRSCFVLRRLHRTTRPDSRPQGNGRHRPIPYTAFGRPAQCSGPPTATPDPSAATSPPPPAHVRALRADAQPAELRAGSRRGNDGGR
jgi:hypothetical protein